MKKVQIGDALNIKASTWNKFIDTANIVQNLQSQNGNSVLKSGLSNGVILVKNITGDDYAQYSALVLSDILIKPENNELEFKNTTPVFTGTKMTEQLIGSAYAILLEPIGRYKIGRALILGITPAKVFIQNPDDKYVEPMADSSSGELQSSASGYVRILWKAGDENTQWCILQVGGTSSWAGDTTIQYNGPFKVEIEERLNVDDSEESSSSFIKIVNGLSPLSEYCGTVTFLNSYDVTCAEYPLQSGYIVLKSEWDTEAEELRNSFEIFSEINYFSNTDQIEYTVLAYIDAQTKIVSQLYNSGNLNIYWRAH